MEAFTKSRMTESIKKEVIRILNQTTTAKKRWGKGKKRRKKNLLHMKEYRSKK